MMRRKKAVLCFCLSIAILCLSGCSLFRSSSKNVLKSSIGSSTDTAAESKESDGKGGKSQSEEADAAIKNGSENNEDGKKDDAGSKTAQKSEETLSQQEDTHAIEQHLGNIMQSAESGTIINLEFKDGETNIYDVEQLWGKADETDYVEAAKGTYSTYSSHNVVFGWNKGGQIFEIRTFEPETSSIPYYMVTKILGDPDYSVDASGERIIGYIVNEKFKVLFVFDGTTDNSKLDHYSVLYPEITVNSMKDDPGREW